MTPQGYIKWKAARGEAGTWDMHKCRAADALIRNTALRNFERYAKKHTQEPIRSFLLSCVSAHFGSVEVDDMLTQLNMYPDWM